MTRLKANGVQLHNFSDADRERLLQAPPTLSSTRKMSPKTAEVQDDLPSLPGKIPRRGGQWFALSELVHGISSSRAAVLANRIASISARPWHPILHGRGHWLDGRSAKCSNGSCCRRLIGRQRADALRLPPSSNVWLEIQWHMFGAMCLLGPLRAAARRTRARRRLVRKFSPRTQARVEVVGTVLFLMPIRSSSSGCRSLCRCNRVGPVSIVQRRRPAR